LPEIRSTHSSRSSREFSEGFSIVELLVALAATAVIAAATLTIAMSSRGMLETDRNRTVVNQSVRAGMDLLGIEIRRAGERLPWDAPAIEIVEGSAGAPDELILRRNLLDAVLPVCQDLTSGSTATSVFVAGQKVTLALPPGCYPVPDDDANGWPDNLQRWREYRIAQGGEARAFVHNPITGDGEFFLFDDENATTFHLVRSDSGAWAHDYPVDQNPRIYILESRRFRLDGSVLQSVVNSDTSSPRNLVDRIADFQVSAVVAGTAQDTLTAGQHWTDLDSLEITLAGESALRTRTMERSVTSRFFPRNASAN